MARPTIRYWTGCTLIELRTSKSQMGKNVSTRNKILYFAARSAIRYWSMGVMKRTPNEDLSTAAVTDDSELHCCG
jgi:hypothetical protein